MREHRAYLGVLLVTLGVLLNPWMLESTVVADGRINSEPLWVAVVLFDFAAVVGGIFLLTGHIRVIKLAYYAAYSAFYVGWFFHRPSPQIFSYSWPYTWFLLCLAVPFLLPPFICASARALGWKKLTFSLIPGALLFATVYFISAQRYYYTQTHYFDPFLQGGHPVFRISSSDDIRAFRVLTLGGSTTWNHWLPEEARYPTVLRNMLQAHYPNVKIEVLNGGMDWYATKHLLISYVTYHNRLHADVIVVMEAINDLYRSCTPLRYSLGEYNDRWNHFYGAAFAGAMPPPFEQYLLERLLPEAVGPGVGELWFATLRYRRIDYPVAYFRSISEFEHHLRRLVQYIGQDGTVAFLMTQPSLYKRHMDKAELAKLWFGEMNCNTQGRFLKREYPSPASMEAAMQAFNALTERVARSEQVSVVDAASRVPKDLEHFIDDVHCTKQGAEIVARAAADAIINSGVVEQAVNRSRPRSRVD